MADEKLKAPSGQGSRVSPELAPLFLFFFETPAQELADYSPQAQCGLLSIFITELLEEWRALWPLSHAVAG